MKAPEYDPVSGFGWDTGFVYAEGPRKGDLQTPDDDQADTDRLGLSDALIEGGLVLLILGVVGGNLRALSRMRGVNPRVVRRARKLRESAAAVAEDYARAVEAIRQAWAPLRHELVDRQLARIPVTRLRETAREPLCLAALEESGIRTVRDLLAPGAWVLAQTTGMGRRAAESAVAAGQRIADEVEQDVVARIDPARQDARTTALVAALSVLVEAGPAAADTAETALELSASGRTAGRSESRGRTGADTAGGSRSPRERPGRGGGTDRSSAGRRTGRPRSPVRPDVRRPAAGAGQRPGRPLRVDRLRGPAHGVLRRARRCRGRPPAEDGGPVR